MTAKCEDFLVKESEKGRLSEDQEQTWNDGLAVAVQVLLPLAIAGVIWGRKVILTRLLLQLDRTCLSVFWPTFSKREKILKWTMTHLPYLDGGLGTIWRDGSQLCTLVNSVVPGACPNPHRHWRKAPTHGQALAYKYLGVTPVFTEDDFNQRNVSTGIEKVLVEYMSCIQQAISKITHNDEITFSNHYIARGMGLVTGEQFRRTILYIYPNYKNKHSNNLLINIRGPYNTHGTATLFGEDIEKLYRTSRSFGSLDEPEHPDSKGFLQTLSSDFHNLLTLKNTKELSCDIDVKIEIEEERAKIIFIPRNSGVYEVCLTTNGEHIAGSPYNINVEKNRSGIVDKLAEDETTIKATKKKVFERHKDGSVSEHRSALKYFYTKYEPRSRLAPLLMKHYESSQTSISEVDEFVELKGTKADNSVDSRSDLTESDLSKSTSKDDGDEDVCFLIINENNNNDVSIDAVDRNVNNNGCKLNLNLQKSFDDCNGARTLEEWIGDKDPDGEDFNNSFVDGNGEMSREEWVENKNSEDFGNERYRKFEDKDYNYKDSRKARNCNVQNCQKFNELIENGQNCNGKSKTQIGRTYTDHCKSKNYQILDDFKTKMSRNYNSVPCNPKNCDVSKNETDQIYDHKINDDANWIKPEILNDEPKMKTMKTSSLPPSGTEKEVDAPADDTKVSDISRANVRETVTSKGRLTKCRAVFDDETVSTEILIADDLNVMTKTDDSTDLRISFLKRKEFWSKFSTPTVSLASSSVSLNDHEATKRSHWFSELPKRHRYLQEIRADYSPRQFRSLDFIDQRRRQRGDPISPRHQYGSVDDLNFPSLKERRELFLKEITSEITESLVGRRDSVKINETLKREKVFKVDLEEKTRRVKRYFGSIHDKIKLFDNGFRTDQDTPKTPEPSKETRLREHWGKMLKELPENGTIKTKIKERFAKAQNFFKTLENQRAEPEINTSKEISRVSINRRHSLDSNGAKPVRPRTKRGGSMRSLNTFPVNLSCENSIGRGESIGSLEYDEVRRLQKDVLLVNGRGRERADVRNVFDD